MIDIPSLPPDVRAHIANLEIRIEREKR